MTLRRFSPPWTIEETAACFIVRDYDARWMAAYGDGPFVSFDPSANRVPDPPVLHGKPFRATKD